MGKKNVIQSVLFVLLVVFIACSTDQEVGPETQDVNNAESDNTLDLGFEEMDDLSFQGIFETSNLGGRIEQDPRIACASVSSVEEPAGVFTVTIDFGAGVECADGRTRAGKIIVTHDGKIWEFGSEIIITSEGYSINGIEIGGVRTITNKTTQTSEGIIHNIVLTDGRVTWPDESFATREVNRTRTWIRDNLNPANDEVWFTGTASGQNRAGKVYTCEILEKVVFKKTCRASGIYVPVQGKKSITGERGTVIIDFGDGTCDLDATITLNGRSKDVTLGGM